MKTRKTTEASFLPAAEWVRRLAEETAAFEVVKVVEAESKRGDRRPMEWDHVITLSVKPDNRCVDLFVQTRQHLSPQTALGVFQRLKWVPPDGVLMVCAPYISPRVTELCREQNVCYLDGVGNCRIAAPGLFVHVSGRPNRRTALKASVDPFSRKSSRIVRTLLKHPDKGWQVQQLAQQADVSLGLVSKVKNALLEEAYLEERDRLLYLRDPGKLLQGWAAQYRPHVKRLQLFAIARPAETETRLADWCRTNGITYALTQLSAAWRYSPFVRYDKSLVYIDKKVESGTNLKSLLGHIDAREVDTGANCTLWITDDPAVFSEAREVDGVKVVSPLQLYLDLKVLAGRGEDAAQEILEKELHTLQPDSRHKSEQSQGGEQ
jgi:Transcriptional regulator, AbiEi antitoxin, Type IV TA system